MSAIDRVWDERQRVAMQLVRLISRARTVAELEQISEALGHVEAMFQRHADALANVAIKSSLGG